ncbi:MAG: phospholipase C, phosphocholine-specific [Azospirillaceae bacterium]|nr:phospholipase C, phosphocholine-specific [Azospirillaceae bacterium]
MIDMPTSNRRLFLKAASAAALNVGLMPAGIRQALALPARRVTGTLRDVEHVIILMQENRSFDHYFGTLRGVRGYNDPRAIQLPTGKAVWHQPVTAGSADAILPFRLNTGTTSADCMKSLDHSWKGSHDLWKHHDAWIPVKGPLTMGHLTREDLPYYHALADAFTLCDAYHCSIHGPTGPNRLYLFSGTSGLAAGHPGLQTVSNIDDGNWTADMGKDDPTFPGFGWTPYSARLTAAGVSWKVYQEYDNFGDNPLGCFPTYRGLDKASKDYACARAWVPGSTPENAEGTNGEHLVKAFADDVMADRLPSVSWIVAPFKMCEHPDAPPAYGEVLTAQLVAALAANPEVWAKTAFILNYDENDGFFDHVAPPLPALDRAQGDSTVSVEGENYQGTPVGLGPRVPLMVISPWTRGGWINSQVFDHTSVIRFLEARFGVKDPNITPWRRAVCGDLTSLFDFHDPNAFQADTLPDTSAYRGRSDASCKLAPPEVPADQAMPRQEPGARPARALPYVLHVHSRTESGGLTLAFVNEGKAGAVFAVRDLAGSAGPWHYTVEPGKRLEGHWPAEAGRLAVYGPNGFLREFHGDGVIAEAAYDVAGQHLRLALRNPGTVPLTLTVRNAYGEASARSHTLAPGAMVTDAWDIAGAGCWYDLEVTCAEHPDFRRRLAGHMETGRPSISDPALG